MSLMNQYMDPTVIQALDPETRTIVERHFQLGLKQVDAKLAIANLNKVKTELASVEERLGTSAMASGPLIRSNLLKTK
jgi:hypothetical protein